jgi:hypothetical protein
MSVHDIFPQTDGRYRVAVGDEMIFLSDLDECRHNIEDSIEELKDHLWVLWHRLQWTAERLISTRAENEEKIDNIIFTNNVKKSYLLSTLFTQLDSVTSTLNGLFEIDIAERNPELISSFNSTYLEIRITHRRVLREIYRTQMIRDFCKLTKQAQISGPWANLDLPMSERVYPFWEVEGELNEHVKSRRNQMRYRQERNPQGFHFVWQTQHRNDPYLFSKRQTDSPYPMRELLAIP